MPPASKLEALSEDTTTHLFGVILNQFGEAHVAGHKDLQLVRRWADMLQGISYESPMWSMIRIGLLRKAGWFDKALQVAGTIEEAQNWHQAIAIGLILRRK